MRARLRHGLTYANVVSTLCLFMLLGGGAYASGLIDGGHLRKRSVSASKLKLNSLTGNEIKESSLARVPNAAHLGGRTASDFLGVDDTAADADTLDGFSSSDFLGAQDTAADSNLLAGRDPSSFLDADRVVTGAGNLASAGQDPILSYDALGLTVSTDGDADSAFTVDMVNTGVDGLRVLSSATNTPQDVAAGSTRAVDVPATVTAASFVVRSATDSKRALEFTCGFDAPLAAVDCAGIGIG
jgi:hypothetical protein